MKGMHWWYSCASCWQLSWFLMIFFYFRQNDTFQEKFAICRSFIYIYMSRMTSICLEWTIMKTFSMEWPATISFVNGISKSCLSFLHPWYTNHCALVIEYHVNCRLSFKLSKWGNFGIMLYQAYYSAELLIASKSIAHFPVDQHFGRQWDLVLFHAKF